MVTELEYMEIFMKEWNNGEVGKQSTAKRNKLHRTAKKVKDCTDRTNQRNRDIYSIAKARNLVFQMDYESLKEFIEKEKVINTNYIEDNMIDILDEMKKTSYPSSDSKD